MTAGSQEASAFDSQMMAIALAVAARGLGTTAPNPAVGAVIADEATGAVIARGWTQPGGRPHAETEALRRAGAHARGRTMYTTLEPCSHHGQTPPCADAIVAAGIARIVTAMEDPDPRVRGAGLARLAAAGLAVTTGVGRQEARWLTLGHWLRVTENRPFVQLKMAVGATGDVPRGHRGAPVWVTGPLARRHAQRLRASADAILVGTGTVADDDPELTCRLPGLEGRSPARIVLTGRSLPDAGSKLLRSAREVPVWLIVPEQGDRASWSWAEALGARILDVPASDGRPDIAASLARLAAEGITRLMVEGGPAIWRSFAGAGFADEIALYRAGGEAGEPVLDFARARHDVARFAPGVDVAPAEARRLGDDTLYTFRRA